jgi:hypothetical protein
LLAANSLAPLKSAYDNEAGMIRSDANARYAALNQQYLRTLDALDAQFKRAGELDALLAVRQERDRFRNTQVITETDIVASPSSLADAQRAYVEAKNQIRRDRDLRLAHRTRIYLEQLAQLKKHLTQQDRIGEALAVQQEEDLVRTSVDLNPEPPPAPPATPPKPTPPGAASPIAPAGSASPHAMKPPKGYLWVYVFDRGQPVRNHAFFFQVEPQGKITEQTSDSFGKLSFLTEAGASYRLRCVSEKYARTELTGLREGESYNLNLQPHPPGAGVVEFRNKIATLPEIGRINQEHTYRGGTAHHALMRPQNARVKVAGPVPPGMGRSSFWATNGSQATFQLGDAYYEVTFIVINDRWFLEYKKLPPPAP